VDCLSLGNFATRSGGGAAGVGQFHGSRFVANRSAARGGGLGAELDSVIESCEFEGKRSPQGAGAWISSRSAVSRCRFSGNVGRPLASWGSDEAEIAGALLVGNEGPAIEELSRFRNCAGAQSRHRQP
jgi:hypothetical protein